MSGQIPAGLGMVPVLLLRKDGRGEKAYPGACAQHSLCPLSKSVSTPEQSVPHSVRLSTLSPVSRLGMAGRWAEEEEKQPQGEPTAWEHSWGRRG